MKERAYESLILNVTKCKSKQTYKKKKQAIAGVARAKKLYGIKYYYYKCSHCRKFHLTKLKQRKI